VFQVCRFFLCFAILFDSWFLLLLCFGLGFLLVASESYFGLDVVYHFRYLYVMCYICDDNNSCRHQHRNARHSEISPKTFKTFDLPSLGNGS